MDKNVVNLIKRINRRALTNNTQRVLIALITAGNEWVSRTSIRVPSAAARVRDLRKSEFGSFKVECASASELNRKTSGKTPGRQTFYRLDPSTVTVSKVTKMFEGVILPSNVK